MNNLYCFAFHKHNSLPLVEMIAFISFYELGKPFLGHPVCNFDQKI